MAYQKLKRIFSISELNEHFTVTRQELLSINDLQIQKEKNYLGILVFLKWYLFSGYPPDQKHDIPKKIVEFIAEQVNIDPVFFNEYKWKDRTWKRHLSNIRKITGFRAFKTKEDGELIKNWLIKKGYQLNSENEFYDEAIDKCFIERIELPSEKEFHRHVNSGINSFHQQVFQKISIKINPATKRQMKACLKKSDSETTSLYWIKKKPGRLSMNTILEEIGKLEFINNFKIDPSNYFKGIPVNVLDQLYQRVEPENSYQVGRHPEDIRYPLMAALFHYRKGEITDGIIRLFLELIHKIEKKADKSIEKQLISNIKKIYGKNKILYKIARASTENPEGVIRDIIFSEVEEGTLFRIIEEFEKVEQASDYDLYRTKTMKQKFSYHYRKMLKPILRTLGFRANNPAHQPIMDGLELVKKYADSRHIYYPENEDIPEKLLTGHWKETVFEKTGNGLRVIKHHFEICVLQRLEKALRCKEVWVEGAFLYRNPDVDLPKDWEKNDIEYCDKHNIPSRAEDFIEPIRKELYEEICKTNEFMGHQEDVYIYYPGGGERGVFRIPKLIARPERPILTEIKNNVINKYGVIDLLDVLIEADRQVNFSQFFHTSAQRQVLNHEDVRERLILCLFAIGTNLGLKRIHAAVNPSFSYDDLLYFYRRFIRIESVRLAISALTTRILRIRNPLIWGISTTCASDGKYIGSWDQNLIAEWNPHYQKTGVMAYWHVDSNETCIYSQLKAPTSTQVMAMIRGLVLHDSEMRIEKNYVDSHGQSEVAFPFCRFIGVDLCPRLKRMKYQRLYLPEKELDSNLNNLKGVLERPIRWNKVYDQYGSMAQHVVAVLEKTGPIESILRRFNRHNQSHPTYKAFIELGKALRTIHVCKVLTSEFYRREIHEALNIVENWNSSNSFICYGRKSELQSNDPTMQELSILCLHLLQNSLILVNTVILEKAITEGGFLDRMTPDDKKSLSPLFTLNINPYGYFLLNFDKPSILEVA